MIPDFSGLLEKFTVGSDCYRSMNKNIEAAVHINFFLRFYMRKTETPLEKKKCECENRWMISTGYDTFFLVIWTLP